MTKTQQQNLSATSSFLAATASAIARLLSVYGHVELLLDNFTLPAEAEAAALHAELRKIPHALLATIPTLDPFVSHRNRNFQRVVNLLSFNLTLLRSRLDQFVLSPPLIGALGNIDDHLGDSAAKIRHALVLHSTYCCNNSGYHGGFRAEPWGVVHKGLVGVWERLKELLVHLDDAVAGSSGFPKNVLRLVARLRQSRSRVSTDEISKVIVNDHRDQIRFFFRAGGVPALLSVAENRDLPDNLRIQALRSLRHIVRNWGVSEIENHGHIVEEIVGGIVTGFAAEDVIRQAVGFLRDFASNNAEFDAQKASRSGTVSTLVSLVSSGGGVCSEDALGLLWELSVGDQNRAEMAQKLDMVWILKVVSSPEAQIFAGALLHTLCSEQKSENSVIAMNAVSGSRGVTVSKLLQQLGTETKIDPSSAVKDDENSGIFVGFAVSMLGSCMQCEQMNGLDLLLAFAGTNVMGVAAAEGAVARVAALLLLRCPRDDDVDDVLLEKATRVLFFLHVAAAANHSRRTWPPAGAVTGLVRLLQHRSIGVACNAVAVLEALSSTCPASRNEILRSDGAAEMAARLAAHAPAATAAAAAGLLWNLSQSGSHARVAISAVRGLPALLTWMLTSDRAATREKAAGLALSLCQGARSRARVAAAAPAIAELLVALLDATWMAAAENAAGALFHLSASPDTVAVVAACSEAPRKLVAMLSCGAAISATLAKYVAGTVANVCLVEVTRVRLRQAGAQSALKNVSKKSTSSLPEEARAHAKRALRNLSV